MLNNAFMYSGNKINDPFIYIYTNSLYYHFMTESSIGT